jgi:outer membrane protein OmpA-like peptidoglycan-associated protein
MAGELVVSGFFRGRFKTGQGVALGMSDHFPIAEHGVSVYEGWFTNTSFANEYKPDTYRTLTSYVLKNVPNVEIESGKDAPFTGNRVYLFKDLVLIDPKIVQSHEVNGSTYGILECRAYGKTDAQPSVKRVNPDPYKIRQEGNEGSDRGDWTGEGNSKKWLPRSEEGCLKDIWKILGFLLLLILLWSLMKSCNEWVQNDRSCEEAEKQRYLLEREKSRRDSLNALIDSSLRDAMANVSLIYFYQNSTEFHISSLGANGTLERLAEVIKTFPDRKFKILTHHSGENIESVDIGKRRGTAVIDHFASKGITRNRFEVEEIGDKEKIFPVDLFTDFEGRRWNKNMRVEIQLIEKLP